jgi:homoserine O-succinyltransferase
MPTKIDTEIQILRLLSGTPLQVEINLVQMEAHTSKNTPITHLMEFYKNFSDIKHDCYDGMIITGAPVERLSFDEVDYWSELCEIMEWSNYNVYSCLHICWGAQAGLFYHYGVDKYVLDEKLTGVFAHRCLIAHHPLMHGLDDIYYAPHSRYTTVRAMDIAAKPWLRLISVSEAAGVHIAATTDCRKIFITGHSEYDRNTLAAEYDRDLKKGTHTPIPSGYFPRDDPNKTPVMNWRSTANLIFCNWINSIIYQNTPYDIANLSSILQRPKKIAM